MAELSEVARKYPSHASSADDANSHVLLCFIWDTFQILAARDSFDPTDARLKSTHPLAD
jgi:hypothetical protein